MDPPEQRNNCCTLGELLFQMLTMVLLWEIRHCIKNYQTEEQHGHRKHQELTVHYMALLSLMQIQVML